MIKTALIYFIFDYCIDKMFEPIIDAFHPPVSSRLQLGRKYSEIHTSSSIGSLAMIASMEGLRRIDCTYYNATISEDSNDLIGMKSIIYERCRMRLHFESADSAKAFHSKSMSKPNIIKSNESIQVNGSHIDIVSCTGYSMISMSSIVGFVE